MEGREALGTRKSVARGKSFGREKKFAWIDCVLLSFHFTCKIPSTFALAVFLSFYFSTCTSVFSLPLLPSVSLSVTHSISFARGVCIFPNAVVHRRHQRMVVARCFGMICIYLRLPHHLCTLQFYAMRHHFSTEHAVPVLELVMTNFIEK